MADFDTLLHIKKYLPYSYLNLCQICLIVLAGVLFLVFQVKWSCSTREIRFVKLVIFDFRHVCLQEKSLKCTFSAPRFHLVLISSLSIFYRYSKIGLKYLSNGPKFLGPLNINPKKTVYWLVCFYYYYFIVVVVLKMCLLPMPLLNWMTVMGPLSFRKCTGCLLDLLYLVLFVYRLASYVLIFGYY